MCICNTYMQAIDEIFDKALGEMVFGAMYAVLCQRLSEVWAPALHRE